MAEPATNEVPEQRFADDPEGWQERWDFEFSAAKNEVKTWHKDAENIVKRFRDDRSGKTIERKVNLFTSNVQTLRSLLYGKTPQVDVERKFGDALDDVARVAGEMLERLLNSDIERDSDSYAMALQYALDDRLLSGMGSVKLRYTVDLDEQEPVEAKLGEPSEETGEPAVLAPGFTPPPVKIPGTEDVITDYVYWKDQLWSPARTFHEVRWWAFREPLSREQLVKRFGEIGNRVPLNTKKEKSGGLDSQGKDPWGRADVWEIWDKEHKKVWWFVEGMDRILDAKDDTLELEGFWPFPRPMFANLTTSSMLPRPDYMLAKDLYEEVDEVSSRIALLERVIKACGVYDRNSVEVKRLLNEAQQNELIPVENWAVFIGEKGGLKGSVDWLPLDMFILALDKLREYRTELMNLLFQVTGMSDIMRGQATAATTATEQAIKARFASVRVQTLQDEFARFASDVQKIKAEIISKHFEPQTIVERSNAMQMFDKQLIGPAVQLIKSKYYTYRIAVKPEAVSLTDYAAMKQERVDFVTAFATFLQSAVPAVQMIPNSTPYLLQILQWAMAGFRGASTVEGILDQAVAQAVAMQKQAEMNPQQPPPDPKLQATQMKGQMDQQHIKTELQADMIRMQKQAQIDAALQQQKHQHDTVASIRDQSMKALVDSTNKIVSGGKAPPPVEGQ